MLFLFNNPVDVGNLISGSFAFSKTSLNIWKFTIHVLLKPGLENFEYYFTSMWEEYNCVVVWNIMRYYLYVESTKKVTNEFIYKAEVESWK